jgi:DNA-directed RNA polymerase subunit beta'
MFTPPPITGLRISLASPEQIRSWSAGEVTSAETLDFRTHKPVRDGLLCERIFGPVKDWTCACGRYRRERVSGFVCPHCGVEVGSHRLRRERMGHIELAVPVAHPWFARATPSILATLLGLSKRQLDDILAYRAYLVHSIDEAARARLLAEEAKRGIQDTLHTIFADLTYGAVLPEERYDVLVRRYGRAFQAQTGGAALHSHLAALNLDALSTDIRSAWQAGQGHQRQLLRRLQIVEALRASGINPSWMLLTVIPILPPDLRPMVPLDGGRFATSDLTLLYARILRCNTRVKHFEQCGAPRVMLNHEKRQLQAACDALFDNERLPHPLTDGYRRPLKSLTACVQGKYGRLRRNLLGKRVDYSGRSVICAGLDLRLHQCGLPKKICVELFKPFLIRVLLSRSLAVSVRQAKRLVERRDPVIWDALAEAMTGKVVLLNRAPTLHRLSIQAFEAVMVEGHAIRLHPLVCAAYNADFDGDQMAVHLPLSDAAQEEARRLLLSTHNLRGPASGEPSITLSQEIVLGLYYLTEARVEGQAARQMFTSSEEARLAYEEGCITLHTPILVRVPDQTILQEAPPAQAQPAPTRGRIKTTVGRLIFNEALPEALRFRNYPMTKEALKQLIAESLARCGEEATARLADTLKQLGFDYATRSGISFGIADMRMPPERQALIAKGRESVQEIDALYHRGELTEEEWSRQAIAVWTQITEEISAAVSSALDPYGALATIVKSGATKARFQQIRQLCGIRGLMARPSGAILPIPILSNYLVGLSTWELFLAASGARKGFMDRSLNTAQSGYLTRRLVEVGMEVWTTHQDCGTHDGILITAAESQERGLADFGSRIVGRVLAESVADLTVGTLLEEAHVNRLLEAGIRAVRVRSPLACQATYGICCRCYGRDLATGKQVRRGVAVGIIAGQSIGEPGTQLTMRTFHSGGIANAQGDITQGLPRVNELFEAHSPQRKAILSELAGRVSIMQDARTGRQIVQITAETASAGKEVLPARARGEVRHRYLIPAGQRLCVEQGQCVEAGKPLCEGAMDPRELLRLCGRGAVQRYLVGEVQRVYRTTGVYINDKHIEVIVRQMLRFVEVTEAGDTRLLPGERVDLFAFQAANAAALAQGGQPALAQPVLLGVTRATLQTASWVAAASFQETSRVLARAALGRTIDPLHGFKERIVLGLPIPTMSNDINSG